MHGDNWQEWGALGILAWLVHWLTKLVDRMLRRQHDKDEEDANNVEDR